MTLTRRARTFKEMTLSGHDLTTYKGDVIAESFPTVDICEHQRTWSEGHLWNRNTRGKQNVGGPFETVRTRYHANYDLSTSYLVANGAGADPVRVYTGNIIPTSSAFNALNLLAPTASDATILASAPSLGDTTLGAKGATAISNCAPTSPVVDGSVAVGELWREGLPALVGSQLWKPKASAAKAAGGEYLNLQFGWLPLVSDIKKTAKAIMMTESIVKQLLRDSGKNVRRHYTFPADSTLEHAPLPTTAYPWPTLSLAHWSNTAAGPVLHTKTERSVWFDGCFTYYVDPESFKGLRGAATQARLIYGAKLTPDVVWNLLGWSWLVDWVINAGPVMKNLGLFANDGLTLRYGYTMEHTVVTRTIAHNSLKAVRGNVPANASIRIETDRKRRLEQSPFVLGLTGSEFTLRRGAILTALGLTRFG